MKMGEELRSRKELRKLTVSVMNLVFTVEMLKQLSPRVTYLYTLITIISPLKQISNHYHLLMVLIR